MRFVASEEYKRSRKRKVALLGLLLVGLVASSAWVFIASDDMYNKVVSAVAAVILISYLPNLWKGFGSEALMLPVVEIVESKNKIEIAHKGAVVAIPLSDIQSLRVQSLKGAVKSVLLTTKSFKDLRFEGYENLAEMARLLERFTPAGKAKLVKWFHR